MSYKVVNRFKDTEDGNHIYQVGDAYPKKGDYKPSKKRIDLLSKEHPKYKCSFIKKVKEDKE